MMQAVYVMRRRNPMTHSPILRIYAQITGSWQCCFWSMHDVSLFAYILVAFEKLGNDADMGIIVVACNERTRMKMCEPEANPVLMG